MSLNLIDVSGVIHRYFHIFSTMRRPSDDAPIGAVYGCCQTFWRIAQQQPSHVAAVYDGKNSRASRQAIFPDYKAHRPPLHPDIVSQFDMVRDAARAFGFPVLEHDGIEADDMIATCVRLAKDSEMEVVITTSDKDLAQLVDDNVSMFCPVAKEMRRPRDVEAKWGVKPENMIDLLALMGDESDGIPGVPKIGIKTAAQLIQTYGDVEAVLANAHLVTQAARRTSLQENAWLARVSKRLVALNDRIDTPIAIDNLAYAEPPMDSISAFLETLELGGLLREMQDEQVAAHAH